MADFFTRLSERAMGRTPTAEPSIAPHFAADATMINTSTEPIEEELTTPTFRPEPDPQKREKVPKPWLATRESNAAEKQSAHRSSFSDQERIKTHRQDQSVQPDPQPNKRTPKSRNEAVKSDLTSRKAKPEDQRPIDTDVPRPQLRHQRSVDTDVPRPQAAQAENSPLLPPVDLPITEITQDGFHPFSIKKPNSAQAADEAPTIRVSIGRIEVRAVTSPQVTRPGRAKRPAPTLSLEDYLKQRNEGRR